MRYQSGDCVTGREAGNAWKHVNDAGLEFRFLHVGCLSGHAHDVHWLHAQQTCDLVVRLACVAQLGDGHRVDMRLWLLHAATDPANNTKSKQASTE